MRILLAVALAASLAACGEEETAPPPPETRSEAQPRPAATPVSFERGKEVVENTCVACHAPNEAGELSRISAARKSPEGWDMTIARMIVAHGLEISSEDRRAAVKYLSDARGLAPSEAEPFRYALERRPNLVEVELLDGEVDERLPVMCGRCHSVARVALQRRDAAEWELLANMHVAQWPTIEYHMLSRDRDWLKEATGWVPELLGNKYPLSTAEWEAWAKAEKPAVEGRWRILSYVPGEGYKAGTISVTSSGEDAYDVTHEGGGPDLRALVFTGYEWRARGELDGRDYRHVAAISPDGATMTGRWFWADTPAIGGSIEAVHITEGVSQVMAANAEGLRPGETAEFSIYGVGLDGAVDLGPGIEIETVSAGPEEVVVRATVAEDAPVGRRDIRVGDDLLAGGIAVYDRIDRLVITPDYAIARVGGNGGNTAPVPTQFEAVAFHNGADGKPDTADDFRIGAMDAEWSTGPYDETAAKMEDAKYAGEINAEGRFTPGPAGPNEDRVFGAGNMGDLTIKAAVKDGDRTVTGEARLIVTAQRWNNPPIY